MNIRKTISFLQFTWFMLISGISFAQLEPITDIEIPCQKVLQIDGNKALGVNFAENKYVDIVLFDINTGEVIETVEGVIYTYAEYNDVWYFYIRYASSSAGTWVMAYSSGELTLLSTYMNPSYDMWVMPGLNGVVGSTYSGIALFTEGAIQPELNLGERVLNIIPQESGFIAITSHTVNSIDLDFNLVSSYSFPDEWESFDGAYLNGDFLLTNSVPFGFPDRSLATYREDIESLTPITNANGEEIIVPSFLLPVGEIEGQFLLAGNGHYANDNNRIVNPTGSGLINPNLGVFTDFSNNLEIYTLRLQPILKQTGNGPLLFGRMGYEGIEPYRISSSGVEVLKDIYPGFGNSMNFDGFPNIGVYLPLEDLSPLDIISKNGILYFSAISPGLGHQIWRSDGTAEGTFAITNITPEKKGIKEAFFSEQEDDIMVSIKYSNDQVYLYKLDENSQPVTDTLPNEKNWEVTYTKNPIVFSGVRTISLNHPEVMLADDGSMVFVLERMDVWVDYFSINHKWVLRGRHIPGFYFNTAIQYLNSDGSLSATGIVRASELERRIIGRRASDGHVFLVVSHLTGSLSNSDIFVNNTELIGNIKGHYLIELDNFGHLVQSKLLPTGGKDLMDMSQIKIEAGGIYMLGQARTGFSMDACPPIYVDPGHNVRTILFKYDFNLEPVWIKPLQTDQFLFGPGLNTLDIDDTRVYVSSGGSGYNVSSTCSYLEWNYRLAGLDKSNGDIVWEQTCIADDVMRITTIRSLDKDQLWLGGYTRGNMSVGEKSLSIRPNYVDCGENGFMLCLSKSAGSVLYLRNNDASRLKFVQDFDFKDDLLYSLSLVYEEDYFPRPIYGGDGRWSLQIDRMNRSGNLIDSLRWLTTLSRFDYDEKLSENKFGMKLHPDGGVIITGQQMWNGSIDGLTTMPVESVGMNTWLISRRDDLSFSKALSGSSEEDGIMVYPNPVSGSSISFAFRESDIGKYQNVFIYNSEGRLIFTKPLYSEFSDHIIELNGVMANGIYLLKLDGTGGEETVKFMMLR
ncbi:T9SS type A sorting domain-containing protein [Cryomorpha ignava]|uniref:T9SS type A sorting domain-containing protein n=1 Tax=Cryomorpha ignava TaxID=101383 RepID=A0A7K3WUG5_9FLAO|nr:T9SS type A sorting domain-containing protein [Cryomorpha ignava]NEN24305.1 T9SS type A sorting domain-containing protein [Cryomorpha ignava]